MLESIHFYNGSVCIVIKYLHVFCRADDKSKKEKSLRRVLWNHKHVGVCRSQESEGQIHPFCITNLIVRACQYGKPRSRKADQEVSIL